MKTFTLKQIVGMVNNTTSKIVIVNDTPVRIIKETAECEEDEQDDWIEVYNSNDDRNGEPRTYCDQPGTFYQTYGNGGGPGGWGGYWVREGGRAVWEVEGSVFKYLDNCCLEVRPQDSMNGRCAAVKLNRPSKN